MIDSLRKRGNYHGPVYVVTEDPTPFEGLDNVHVVVVPYTRYRLVIKTCKQLMLDWASEPRLLYIDADIIIGRPLAEWYRRARPKLDARPLVLYTGNMPVAGAYHAGLMLMDRERVRPFFDRWLRLIRTGRYQLDQWSMHSIITDDDVARFDDEELVYLHQILGPDHPDFDPERDGAGAARHVRPRDQRPDAALRLGRDQGVSVACGRARTHSDQFQSRRMSSPRTPDAAEASPRSTAISNRVRCRGGCDTGAAISSGGPGCVSGRSMAGATPQPDRIRPARNWRWARSRWATNTPTGV